jgi:hypothetical protein
MRTAQSETSIRLQCARQPSLHPSRPTLTSLTQFEIWRARFLTIKGPATNAKEVGVGNPAEENVLLPGLASI